jgi:hypothetical protein
VVQYLLCYCTRCGSVYMRYRLMRRDHWMNGAIYQTL